MIGDNENTTPDGSEEEIIEAEIVEETENTDLSVRTIPAERKIHKIRRWVLKSAIALVVLGLLIYLIAALGYRIGLFSLGTSLMTMSFTIGPIVLVAGMTLGLLSVLMSWFIHPRKGLLLSLIALAVPLGALLKGISIYNTGQTLPAIHDIATDRENPPKFTQAIIDARTATNASNTLEYLEKKDKPDGKLVSLLQYEAYPDIDAVQREEKPDVVYGEAKKLIGSRGWEVVTEDADKWLLEATDTTFWYGFKDDIIVQIRPSRNGGSIIDIRSVSRIGRSDFGVNAERIRELIEDLRGG